MIERPSNPDGPVSDTVSELVMILAFGLMLVEVAALAREFERNNDESPRIAPVRCTGEKTEVCPWNDIFGRNSGCM